jgi:4-hydroxybenzoate polyprenyltransferase
VLLQFNRFTVMLGIASLAIVAIYPLMKRITDWPQLILGFAFSYGALMGWPALFGRLDAAPVLLYAGAICWTIGYDTIYALQDKEDDALIGVRSTARLFGASARPALTVLFGLANLFFVGSFVLAGVGWLAYAGLVAGIAHMTWQLRTLDPDDPRNCLARFRANRDYGLVILAGLVLDGLVTAG